MSADIHALYYDAMRAGGLKESEADDVQARVLHKLGEKLPAPESSDLTGATAPVAQDVRGLLDDAVKLLERIGIKDGMCPSCRKMAGKHNKQCSILAILDRYASLPSPSEESGEREGGVIEEIAAERQRQMSKEGFDESHDDKHTTGDLALAAACYAAPGNTAAGLPWPWHPDWFKKAKHDRRRQLVIAGALIVAELERSDRNGASSIGATQHDIDCERADDELLPRPFAPSPSSSGEAADAKGACPVCGCEELDHRDLWTCRCPAPASPPPVAPEDGVREAEEGGELLWPTEPSSETVKWRRLDLEYQVYRHATRGLVAVHPFSGLTIECSPISDGPYKGGWRRVPVPEAGELERLKGELARVKEKCDDCWGAANYRVGYLGDIMRALGMPEDAAHKPDAHVGEACELAGSLIADNKRLASLGRQQQSAIEDLQCMEDAVERLRDIGRVTGCDHVDDPDGRLNLVRCVETTISDLENEVRKWKPMTATEAEAALAAIEEQDCPPMSDAEIERVVACVTDPTYMPTEPEHIQLIAQVRHLAAKANARIEALETKNDRQVETIKRDMASIERLTAERDAAVAKAEAWDKLHELVDGRHQGDGFGTCGHVSFVMGEILRASRPPLTPSSPQAAEPAVEGKPERRALADLAGKVGA